MVTMRPATGPEQCPYCHEQVRQMARHIEYCRGLRVEQEKVGRKDDDDGTDD